MEEPGRRLPAAIARSMASFAVWRDRGLSSPVRLSTVLRISRSSLGANSTTLRCRRLFAVIAAWSLRSMVRSGLCARSRACSVPTTDQSPAALAIMRLPSARPPRGRARQRCSSELKCRPAAVGAPAPAALAGERADRDLPPLSKFGRGEQGDSVGTWQQSMYVAARRPCLTGT